MRHRLCLVVAAAGALAVAGCGRMPAPRERPAPPVASEGSADWHWERREDPAHLRTAIALYRQGFDRQPSLELCDRLCRACFLLAEDFLADDPGAQDEVYVEAASYALAGLRLQNEVAAALGERADLGTAAIALVDADHGGALFWWVAHFGQWLCHRNLVAQLAQTGRVLAAMKRIEQLRAEVVPGSRDRMWGAYYARRGDFRRAREHFDAAARAAPHILYTRILCATDCALRARDRELFVRQLRLALDEKEPDSPDWRPEFRLDRERARRLLARTDTLFPK